MAVALVTLAPARPAPAVPERSFVYLAASDSEAWSGAFEAMATPGGELAPFGSIAVTATGTRLTVHLDDTGTDDGLAIPVRVFDGRWQVFAGCVPVRAAFTINHVHPNQDLLVQIGEYVVDQLVSQGTVELHCPAMGTTGVATITGVR
jgi:hypothetical protein